MYILLVSVHRLILVRTFNNVYSNLVLCLILVSAGRRTYINYTKKAIWWSILFNVPWFHTYTLFKTFAWGNLTGLGTYQFKILMMFCYVLVYNIHTKHTYVPFKCRGGNIVIEPFSTIIKWRLIIAKPKAYYCMSMSSTHYIYVNLKICIFKEKLT